MRDKMKSVLMQSGGRDNIVRTDLFEKRRGELTEREVFGRFEDEDKTYGVERMENAVRELQARLGNDYEPERRVIRFELGSYLDIRERMMIYKGLTKKDVEPFDRRVEGVILG